MSRPAEPAGRAGAVPAAAALPGGRPGARRPASVASHAGRGFSLIEMLVALAIFGLAVLGLLNLAGESTRTALVIEERVLAGVVAGNLAVDAMTLDAAALGPDARGHEAAGDIDWRWTRTVTPTDDADLLRVDIVVMPPGEDHVAAELSLLRGVGR